MDVNSYDNTGLSFCKFIIFDKKDDKQSYFYFLYPVIIGYQLERKSRIFREIVRLISAMLTTVNVFFEGFLRALKLRYDEKKCDIRKARTLLYNSTKKKSKRAQIWGKF